MKINKKIKFYLLFVLILTISGCMQQESTEMGSSEVEQVSNLDPTEGDEQDTLIEVSLGGASRAERFMGSYDEIERLALDVVRNYGNKEVVTDLMMDNSSGIWTATVPKMIVGFDYTVRGHAYKSHQSPHDDWIAPFEPSSGEDIWGAYTCETNYSFIQGLGYNQDTFTKDDLTKCQQACTDSNNCFGIAFQIFGDVALCLKYHEDLSSLYPGCTNCTGSGDGKKIWSGSDAGSQICFKGSNRVYAGKWIEIFQGEAQLTVKDGTNTLDMRLAPILDNRTMTVPRITRIQRPFQLGVEETEDIEVTVDTLGTGSDGDINYRFRAVDFNSLPVGDNANRGTFSDSEGVESGITSTNQGVIDTQYTAPNSSSPCFDDGDVAGQCPQKIQIRVSNLQEIGVSSHFTVYVTDNETAETIIDNNPVISSISAERVDSDKLQFTIEVSDDDLFDDLDVNWDYLFGENRGFNDNVSDKLTDYTGVMRTVMDYADSDEGMLLVTVCEKNEPSPETYAGCSYATEASTSVQLELIPNAYPEIVICDETGCELPSRLAGTRISPKKWYSCSQDNDTDHYQLHTWSFTFKDFEYSRKDFGSSAQNCHGTPEWTSKVTGSAQQNSASAFVYPTINFVDNETGDNVSVFEVKLTVASNTRTLFDASIITSYNDNKTCGYNANDWGDNVTLDVSGCSAVSPKTTIGDNLSFIFYQENNILRFGDEKESESFPRDLKCITFSNDSLNPGDESLCIPLVMVDSGTCQSNGYHSIISAEKCMDTKNHFSDISSYAEIGEVSVEDEPVGCFTDPRGYLVYNSSGVNDNITSFTYQDHYVCLRNP